MTSGTKFPLEILDSAREQLTQGFLEEAASTANEALEAAEKSGDKSSQAWVRLALVEEFMAYCEESDALDSIEQAKELFKARMENHENDNYGEACANIALGDLHLKAGRLGDALQAGKTSMHFFKAVDVDVDVSRSLSALSLVAKAYIAQQETEKAWQLLQMTAEQFQAANNIPGFSGTIEQHIALKWELKDFDGAIDTADRAMVVFQVWQDSGGIASMWLAIARAFVQKYKTNARDIDSQNKAMEAAQKASQLFTELHMYDSENEAMQVYNHINNMKKQDNMVQIPVESFYEFVRVAGIQYGPCFRINDTMMYNSHREVPNLNIAALKLLDGPVSWEKEVEHDPALLDAALHATLGSRKVVKPTEEELETQRRAGQESSAQLPYALDRAEFYQNANKIGSRFCFAYMKDNVPYARIMNH